MVERSPALHLNKSFTKFKHSLFNKEVQNYSTRTLRAVMKLENLVRPQELSIKNIMRAEKKGLVLHYTDEFINRRS